MKSLFAIIIGIIFYSFYTIIMENLIIKYNIPKQMCFLLGYVGGMVVVLIMLLINI